MTDESPGRDARALNVCHPADPTPVTSEPTMDDISPQPQTAISPPACGPARANWFKALERAVEEDVYSRLCRERECGGGDELVADVAHGLRQRLHLAIDLGCDAGEWRDQVDQLEQRGAA